ncbi:MAG: hypothetical protein ACI835_003146 [Planctomycetota bacterium]|jgi:hypothetical protein
MHIHALRCRVAESLLTLALILLAGAQDFERDVALSAAIDRALGESYYEYGVGLAVAAKHTGSLLVPVAAHITVSSLAMIRLSMT